MTISFFRPIPVHIYKISVEGYDKCYIGSTKKPIHIRLSEHRATFKSKRSIFFCSSSELIKYAQDNDRELHIECLDTLKLASFDDVPLICARENYFIDAHKDVCVNKRRAKR